MERVYYHKEGEEWVRPHRPQLGFIFQKLRVFTRKLHSHLGFYPPRSPEQFARGYLGRRRHIYERAAEEYNTRGVSRLDSFVHAFVKAEKCVVAPYTFPYPWPLHSRKGPAPRAIQPRKPIYNVGVGRYIHHMEWPLYKAIEYTFGYPVVSKGLSVDQTAKLIHSSWTMFKRPGAMVLDASRFDQHVSAALLQWEHSIYLSHCGFPDELSQYFEWQRDNKGRFFSKDGTVKYRVDGSRMTGDMNTAMGNCLIMCAMIFSFLEDTGFGPGVTNKIRFINNGDDCVLIGEIKDLQRLSPLVAPWFGNMGFIMKIDPIVDTLEKVQFCHMHPVFDGIRWRMVRIVPDSFDKDSFLIKPIESDSMARRYIRAIGDAGLSLTGGLPVLQAYYEMFRRVGDVKPLTDPSMESGFYWLAKKSKYVKTHISDDARVSFCFAFGLPPDLQVQLEESFDSWVWPKCLKVSPDEATILPNWLLHGAWVDSLLKTSVHHSFQ